MSIKPLKQIEVCTSTYCAVNCGKGMEYCKGCGQQKTGLIKLVDAQKEIADLKEVMKGFETALIKITDIAEEDEAKIEAANKIISEMPRNCVTLCPNCKTVSSVTLTFNQLQWLTKLKAVLEIPRSEDKLTPEEIVDVEASEKEIKEGKCKTYNTAKELIEDLRKSRKEEAETP